MIEMIVRDLVFWFDSDEFNYREQDDNLKIYYYGEIFGFFPKDICYIRYLGDDDVIKFSI